MGLRARGLVWLMLDRLGRFDPGSNPGGPTISDACLRRVRRPDSVSPSQGLRARRRRNRFRLPEPRSCDASFNRQRVRGLMEYKTVTAGTREDGGQGVIEDSVELVAVLDAQVNDAIRLGWRPVGVVVTGPDGRMNQSMVRVR